MAVGLLPALLEAALVELPEAVGADEVLRVELAHHGGDHAPGDAPVAGGAGRLGAAGRGGGDLWKGQIAGRMMMMTVEQGCQLAGKL